ncbi:MAG: type II toxin-antitoxin system RelE/ParE family toxin [Rhodospirillales bacterium]|nr:type II toxin-antitoxin system RelE/ParE family toxin [Rhodospirillales bacterium]
MARVVYSRNAASNIERLHRFLAKNPDAAARAANAILDGLATLARFPRLGPVDPDRPDTRQFFIRFGAAGYVARYRVLDDTVIVLAIRHMREAGYSEEPPKPRPRVPSSRRRRS